VKIEAVNARLTTAVNVRVEAHRAREDGRLDVPFYIARLAWARRVEAELEPLRRTAGYVVSRAYELCTAHTADFYRPRAR
jgi:hypothetical protein